VTAPAESARRGAAAALAAYLLWGVFGLYFKALAGLPAPEVLAHRILGGALFALLLLVAAGRAGEVWAIVADTRRLRALAASALAISVNWGLFIWAVGHGRALEASMGYFIFPLVSVVLARVVLGEVLDRRRLVAVAIVAAGVAWLVVRGHAMPWVALVLAASFGAYGLIRKTVPVSALAGLFIEAALLAPVAVIYLVWAGGGAAPAADGRTLALLAVAGPVTAVPLVLFAFAARRLRLSTIGLLMYVNPTIQMAVAVWVFGETFTVSHAVAFAAIWAGLAVYSWPSRRSGRVAPAPPVS
jgi:chloramphenicol-sensitive protein RarD